MSTSCNAFFNLFIFIIAWYIRNPTRSELSTFFCTFDFLKLVFFLAVIFTTCNICLFPYSLIIFFFVLFLLVIVVT